MMSQQKLSLDSRSERYIMQDGNRMFLILCPRFEDFIRQVEKGQIQIN